MEVLLLVVVETHVEIAHGFSADGDGVDKACLVERGDCRVATGKRTCVCMAHDAPCQRHVAAAEKTNAGGVATHHRHVSAQGAQSAAHADEARRAVQVFTAQVADPVNVLCDHRSGLSSQQEGTGYKKYVTSHSFTFLPCYLRPPKLRPPPRDVPVERPGEPNERPGELYERLGENDRSERCCMELLLRELLNRRLLLNVRLFS